jgi:hypothetical protein
LEVLETPGESTVTGSRTKWKSLIKITQKIEENQMLKINGLRDAFLNIQ